MTTSQLFSRLKLVALFLVLFQAQAFAAVTCTKINPSTGKMDCTGYDFYMDSCASKTTDGVSCWDRDDNILYTGTGSGVTAVGGSGAFAPTNATYITQTTNSTLSAEQALSSLSTGLMKVTTSTGVISSVTDSAGISALLSDETGSGVAVFGTSPTFTTSILLGSAGVSVANDGDGAITFLGLGDGFDEDVTMNLDDTSNTAVFTSSTSLNLLSFPAMDIAVEDEAYDATNWNASLQVPTKNAVRDKIEAITASDTFQRTSTVLNAITSTDNLTIGSSTNLAKISADGDTDEVQLLIQGNSTQTSNLVVFEKSDGTDLWTLANDGTITSGGSGTESATFGGGSQATYVTTYNLSGTDWTMTAGSGLATFSNAVTVTGNLTNSTLTSGRVTVSSTSGLLADDADLTFATDTLTATKIAATTLSGTATLAENSSIALDPAGSADGKYTGVTVTGTGGATIAFGDLITLDKDDSRWELVDISVAAAATGDARGVLGMAVTSSTDGGALTVLLVGIIRADANFPALTIGAPVYASTTGDIVVTQPTTTDHVIRIIGAAMTADELYFNPDNTWTTHT